MNLHEEDICSWSLLSSLYVIKWVTTYTSNQFDDLLIPTIFDLCDIPHHYVSHGQLYDLATADHLEFLLLLNTALQPTKLLLLWPVVEGRNQHHTHHRQEDGCALNPASVRLALILYPACCRTTGCSSVTVTAGRRGKLYKNDIHFIHIHNLHVYYYYCVCSDCVCV